MWVAFTFAKATHIFFQKNTCELDIVLTRTINITTTNELVKLTTLWTTEPRRFAENKCLNQKFLDSPLSVLQMNWILHMTTVSIEQSINK